MAYKGFRSKLNVQNKNPRTKISKQPNSAPNSPSMQRPSRPHTTVYRKETSNGIQRSATAQKRVKFKTIIPQNLFYNCINLVFYFYSLLKDAPSSPPPQLNLDLMEDLKDFLFPNIKNTPRNNTPSSLLV